ncbi:type II toxin-antitoxin system HicA family toxin [Geminocystis sp. GBBB08]|uniref:type II toxin-antitoxin system HicA family toxin n=1 Tax=Geminocystis sp. GBBB08 TaxID=2604140 RepID=UPI0027E371B1|nr:type II toxin-antitoxin system HicA family toxin [Geminocystis sp. GBBB08]
MGRLSGFSDQKVTQKLNKLGFEFYRTAKRDHEIWFNPETKAKTTIPLLSSIKISNRSRWRKSLGQTVNMLS